MNINAASAPIANAEAAAPMIKQGSEERSQADGSLPLSAPNAPYPVYQQCNHLAPPAPGYPMYGYWQSSPDAMPSPHLPMVTSNGPASLPNSPSMLDASQMLMSPGRFRKRRHPTPLIAGGYMNPLQSPALQSHQLLHSGPHFLRRAPVPKIPVTPKSVSAGSSPRARPANLILPCFFDQNNRLRTHGPNMINGTGPSAYWDDFKRNVAMFLAEVEAINEVEITIVEIKQLLRKYSINATGKKHILMDRIKTLQAHLKAQQALDRVSLSTSEDAKMHAKKEGPGEAETKAGAGSGSGAGAETDPEAGVETMALSCILTPPSPDKISDTTKDTMTPTNSS